MSEPRVAVVADLRSERWTSMDLVADMLLSHLGTSAAAAGLSVEMLCPDLPPSPLRYLPRGATLERYRQRFVAYPRWLARRAGQFQVCHVVDHSYAHVVLNLPAAHTVVTCHDADSFLPLVAPHLTSSRLPLALVPPPLRGYTSRLPAVRGDLQSEDEGRALDVPTRLRSDVPHRVPRRA